MNRKEVRPKTFKEKFLELFCNPTWIVLVEETYQSGQQLQQEWTGSGFYTPSNYLSGEDLEHDPFALPRIMIWDTWKELKSHCSTALRARINREEARTLFHQYVPYPELWEADFECDPDWMNAEQNPTLRSMDQVEALFKDTAKPLTSVEKAQVEEEPDAPVDLTVCIESPIHIAGGQLIIYKNAYSPDPKGITTAIGDFMKMDMFDPETYFQLLVSIFNDIYFHFHDEHTYVERERLDEWAKKMEAIFLKRWDRADNSTRAIKVGRTYVALGLFHNALSEKNKKPKGLYGAAK